MQFETQTAVSLVVVALLLCMSAGVSGSETAFFSLSPSDMAKLKKSESPADKAILKLLDRQDYLLATILIVNNLVNICIVILSSSAIDKIMVFHSTVWEMVFKTVIVTFLLLLFGEIMPKVYASYHQLRFARATSRALGVAVKVVKPFAYVLIKSGGVINERLSRKKAQISIDELSDAIEITSGQTEEEKQMLSGIVSFVNRDASAVMVLRMDIVALDISVGFDRVKSTIIESGFSRIPVYEDNLDNIKGLLYVKDMMPFILKEDDFEWQQHLRTPYFVPENKKINDLMEEFQTQKMHMAIVVDEYGATRGLVSLEDIMEEIVGEITDEWDSLQSTFYKQVDDNTYMFEGKTHLADFIKVMGLGDDYFEEVDAVVETLAGLLLELKRDFVRKNEKISYGRFSFRVKEMDGRRIDKIEVKTENE